MFQALIGCGRVQFCSLRLNCGGPIKAMADTNTSTDTISMPNSASHSSASGYSLNPFFNSVYKEMSFCFLFCFLKLWILDIIIICFIDENEIVILKKRAFINWGV